MFKPYRRKQMNKDLFYVLTREIDENFLMERLKEMIAIKSENPFDEEPRPGYREKEMGEYYAETMTNLGLEVDYNDILPGRPNVFGHSKGLANGPTLMLAGHMDTARTDGYEDAYDVKVEEGKIFGRGACDMKAALAAYLEVARILKTAKVKLNGNLILAGIMDEEYRMLGSQDIGKNGPHADQGIIGEPCDLTICPTNKGRVSTYIRTFGTAAHSSVPENGDNAISRMAKVIQIFSDYNEELLKAEPHQLCGYGRFNPGVIRGGVQVNMVPDHCELEVDRRTLPGETKEKVYDEFHLRLNRLVQEDPGFKYKISEPTWLIPPNEISSKEAVVKSLLSAHEQVLGRAAQVTAFPAGSDAPYMGFPTVVCGPGSITQAHSTREFVSLEQVVGSVKMYLWTIVDLLT
jgi:acetylornithine deacetylase/succinyl-diaminopimelate desuccinylase family protein